MGKDWIVCASLPTRLSLFSFLPRRSLICPICLGYGAWETHTNTKYCCHIDWKIVVFGLNRYFWTSLSPPVFLVLQYDRRRVQQWMKENTITNNFAFDILSNASQMLEIVEFLNTQKINCISTITFCRCFIRLWYSNGFPYILFQTILCRGYNKTSTDTIYESIRMRWNALSGWALCTISISLSNSVEWVWIGLELDVLSIIVNHSKNATLFRSLNIPCVGKSNWKMKTDTILYILMHSN